MTVSTSELPMVSKSRWKAVSSTEQPSWSPIVLSETPTTKSIPGSKAWSTSVYIGADIDCIYIGADVDCIYVGVDVEGYDVVVDVGGIDVKYGVDEISMTIPAMA